MTVFDTWSNYVAQVLKSESHLAASLVEHGGELGSAREALIKGVLSRILPSIYEVGSGQIVDHQGNHSRQIDIVIARRDFPTLLLPSDAKVYLVESVLATIEVKSTLNKTTLMEGLENCASVADLSPNVVAGVLDKLAAERGLRKEAPGSYTHDDPLETGRFDLLGRPASYVFGFSGYKGNYKNLAEAMSEWATEREKSSTLAMRHFPAVIVSEGCISWRNAPPYSSPKNVLCFISIEETPLRLLVLHLLYTLGRKIPVLPDIHGIVPNLEAYIQRMTPPAHPKIGVGKAVNKPLK